MPCYHPIRRESVPKDGRRSFGVVVPCGRCIGCRLERSRQWAVRCMHEASLYDANCWITLTYADEHLPRDGSLDRRAFPLFMKRLRQDIAPEKVRFFHAGEYGEDFGRPHYHALLFGYDFQDKEFWTERGSNAYFRSARLESLWKFGHSEISNITFDAAAYVARYCVKKVTGEEAELHYCGREPEYATMSRRPGIGAAWIDRFYPEVYSRDSVVVNGHEAKPPRYYDLRAGAMADAEGCVVVDFDDIKAERESKRKVEDETFERLVVRETVAKAKLNLSRRGLK